jgi:hypothetical protein
MHARTHVTNDIAHKVRLPNSTSPATAHCGYPRRLYPLPTRRQLGIGIATLMQTAAVRLSGHVGKNYSELIHGGSASQPLETAAARELALLNWQQFSNDF